MSWEKVLGSNIRRLRKAKGLTQEELAHQAGMAMRYVAGVERGEENPSLKYLIKLAEVLDTEPGRLLEKHE